VRFLLISLAAAALSASLSPPLAAQTNDVLFRAWRWEERLGGARPAGMGDAFVAVADDFSAAIVNPAGLARCGRFVEGTFGAVVSKSAPVGPDQSRFRGSASPLGANVRLGCRWAAAVYFVQPRSIQLDLGGRPLPNGSRYTGSLREATAKGPGVALGFRAHPMVTFGVSLNLLRLRMTGAYSAFAPSGVETLRTSIDDKSPARLTGSVGTVVDATRRFRLGLVYRWGGTWPIARHSVDAVRGTVLDAGTDFEVRAPDVLSGGAAWDVRVGHRRQWLTLAGQLDRVAYSQVLTALTVRRGPFPAGDYALSNGLEPHLGLEWSIPTACWSGCGSLVQIRAGAHRQAAGTLSYRGTDPVEAATFPGARGRWVWSTGASLGTKVTLPIAGGARVPLRVDTAVRFGDQSPTVFVLDLALRYGVTFGDVGPR
jgi:hypothetical protein